MKRRPPRWPEWVEDEVRRAALHGRKTIVPVHPSRFATREEYRKAVRAQARHEEARLVEIVAMYDQFDAAPPTGPEDLVREPGRSRFVEHLRETALARRYGIRVHARAPELLLERPPGPAAPVRDLAVAAGAGRALWDEPPEAWLALATPYARGEYVALAVAGESMTPLLRPRDVILVRLGTEVERRRIVVARGPDDGYVVKCVGEIGARAVRLDSLNPLFASVDVPHDGAHVLGRVVQRWRSS